jgi:glycosyltransferase involved in cell wall biosynthesis
MRILLVNQFFHPDSAATSQFLTDLARELVAQGEEVAVICGESEYGSADAGPPPAVTILRVKALPFGRSVLTRVRSYATFLSSALIRALRIQAPDVVLTLTTPPLLGIVGTLVKRFRSSRHFLWEMDIYPDIAEDLGALRSKSILAKLAGRIADYSRHRADGIIALGDDMKTRLIHRGIAEAKIHVAHNWADGREIEPLAFRPLPPLTIHYSGNFGLAHDTRTIRDAMRALRSDSRFRFIIAGGGSQRKDFEAFCDANSPNQTEFRPYCDRTELGKSLAEGHIGLVTQKPETIGSVVPSKIYGIMAAGRPILYIGSREATPARIIEHFHCGWQIDVGNSEAVVALLHRLLEQPNEIMAAGERAREALTKNFDRPLGVARIISILGFEDKVHSPLTQYNPLPVAQPLAGKLLSS